MRLSVWYWIVALGLSLITQAQAAVVLQYHHISETSPHATSTSPAQFREHMDYLAANDYDVVALTELLKSGSAIGDRRKRVAITFDDAYDSIYLEAFKLLRQRNWPFTIFVSTRPLDDKWAGFASWDQLREMARFGATIANHTHSHDHLIRHRKDESQAVWRARVKHDILLAERRIEREIGQHNRLLAYPYGEFNGELIALLQSMGFEAFGQHSGPLGDVHTKQSMPRFPFGGHYGELADFVTKVGSIPLPVSRVYLAAAPRARHIEPVLPVGRAQPELVLEFSEDFWPANEQLRPSVQCFASAMGAVGVVRQENGIRVRLDGRLPAGRSRINCTADAGQGRFYWYSQPFFRPDDTGQWPSE